jgi:transcriptional repressor NrdR
VILGPFIYDESNNVHSNGADEMKCPSCQNNGTRVIDSRPVDEGRAIRRRRECEECFYRFTTFEKVEETPLIVVKKEGIREEFSREKILRGLIKACEKRPVSLAELEKISLDIEKNLRGLGYSEVGSEKIGELVMDKLSSVDEVSYVRFASVYRQFKDINVFLEELKELIKKEQ